MGYLLHEWTYCPMPYSDHAALDGFVDELRRAWTAAGPPSYQEFEKLSQRVKALGEDQIWLTRSTTQDILAGRRRQLPKWRWVARFITVLRVAAKEGGVNPEDIGTLAEWKQKHEIASAAVVASHRLAPAAGGREPMPGPSVGVRGRAGVSRRATGLLLNDKDAERDPDLAVLLQAVGHEWWRDYGDLIPDWPRAYLSLEPAASVIRAYETALMPAWLQTEAYAAEAIKLSWPGLGESAVARLVDLRMRRQQFLDQPGGARLWVIVEETAVRRRVGSMKTMRMQIRHLMEISEQPNNITIQVMPVDTRVHAVAGGPITFLRFPRSDLPDVVYLEQLTGALYLPRRHDVVHYIGALSSLGVEALEPAATRDFLREILMEL